MTSTQKIRVFLALAAASVGVEICLYQQHFTLDWRNPAGFGVMFEHRCGLVMVAAVGWMAVEVARVLKQGSTTQVLFRNEE